jgi:hypothetical protein
MIGFGKGDRSKEDVFEVPPGYTVSRNGMFWEAKTDSGQLITRSTEFIPIVWEIEKHVAQQDKLNGSVAIREPKWSDHPRKLWHTLVSMITRG